MMMMIHRPQGLTGLRLPILAPLTLRVMDCGYRMKERDPVMGSQQTLDSSYPTGPRESCCGHLRAGPQVVMRIPPMYDRLKVRIPPPFGLPLPFFVREDPDCS